MTSQKRNRRTPEQMIEDLRGEIERIKARAAQAKLKKDPALRHISAAVRSIDKAMAETEDKPTRTALMDSRAALASCLALPGMPVAGNASTLTPKRRISNRPDPDQVLAYLEANPGSRSADICDELGTDPASLRPVLHTLRDNGSVKVEGKARAMRYSTKA
ncbi:MAG: hypothetical protein ACI841_002841 [Planctomycetota bacterium]|jgi:hypothetical protein